MKKDKLKGYESPNVDVFTLCVETGVLTGSPQYGSSGAAGGSLGLGDNNYNYGSF